MATAAGARSAAWGSSSGIVQTGDRARAVQFTGPPVPLGPPSQVPVPVAGLVGLPKPPARTFVGRDEQLAQVGRLVAAGAGVVAQAVHGLGGVGKSELALQFAHARRGQFTVVWWVLADTPAAIESGLAELAFRLHPDAQVAATDEQAAVWAVGWLQSHPGWLLVLDNVEHRDDVEPLLADLTGGHVLITTRRDVGWEDITDGCLRLEVLRPDAAVALLRRLSGQDDPASAAVLAGELGCLPLALQQAGAYLRQTRTAMAGYLLQLRQDPAGMLRAVAADTDAERAVARVWSVTLTEVAAHNRTAVTVLNVLSCLAPDDLPREVLSPLAGSAADLDQALGLLASYNMLTLTDATVTVHRLVQAVIRAQLQTTAADTAGVSDTAGSGAWTTTLRTALDALNTARPEVEFATWPRWAVLSPHISALAGCCDDATGGNDLASLIAANAYFDWEQGRYQAAVQAETRALAISEQALGPNHSDVATRLHNLAVTLRALGRAGEAEPLQRRALAISEQALGPDHPYVAARLDNLALTLADLGRAGEAEPLQRRALAISEQTLGPDHPTVATRLNNLAITLRQLGRPGEAEPLQRRALAISEQTLGPDHPYVATELSNLAVNLRQLGRAAEAEPLQRRALAISEQALDPYHPTVAIGLNNLAVTLRDLGRAAEAEPLQRRALAISEHALGPDHPDVAVRLGNLAATLRDLGRAAEAEPLQQRAEAIRQAP
ncbi:tetratricopeptide repeat protein [Actinoplanes sp. KI2]|uniref:tetratricopeptide repeat protein n=1 Tax=Actinoplanes sp. KI2 TaxID=2983315 RepID=UPI0021D601A5|nr:tetratricopeptide repeat protein [Actinoplanes sp. KI2]MCU7725757.1 tetratricopeptide repeat protein [Actinoplanes sp. KI2]